MPRVRYSARAVADLERLFRFLAVRDAGSARRAVREIRDAVAGTAKMPEIGRLVGDGLRELIIDFGNSGYLVLYDFDQTANEVVALAIRHQLELDYK